MKKAHLLGTALAILAGVASIKETVARIKPEVKPQRDPEELSARQRKRQAKLARRAPKKKQYQVRYIGTYFKELLNQTAIAIDDGNTAYLMCQFDDNSLIVAGGDPEKIEHCWVFGWHQIPRKDLQRVVLA